MAYNFPKNLVLLATRTASSSASLEFTSVISSNYSNYYVSIRDLIPASNAVSLLLTFSSDNGSTYKNTSYGYDFADISSTPSNTQVNNDSTSSITLVDNLSSTTSRGFSADYTFFGLNQSSTYINMGGYGCHYSSGTQFVLVRNVGGYFGLAAINAIKFAMGSGNIASGSIQLYGENF